MSSPPQSSAHDRQLNAAVSAVGTVCAAVGEFAPQWLAEDWDNVGLILGDRAATVSRIMTCLTLTSDVATEAIEGGAELVVTHHPMPFRPLAKITSDRTPGRLVLRLAAAGVSVYSPHTAFDSAAQGINQMWADALSLSDVSPLKPTARDPAVGSGRVGRAAGSSVGDLIERCRRVTENGLVRLVGESTNPAGKVAVACGSGGSFLDAAVRRGCHTLITGEATFHQCLDAREAGINLILLGHYQSERFAIQRLADWLGKQFPPLDVWASRMECDPLGGGIDAAV